MKTISLSLSVVGCVLLANCSSPVAMTRGELADVLKESPLAAKRVSVSVRVTPPGAKEFSFPAKNIRLGESFSQEVIREFIYPAGYSAPGIAGGGIEPATPERFETVNTGVTMDLKAEASGSLVIVSGKVEVSKFDRFIRMGGELGHPITDEKGKTLTENRVEMPAIRTYMTPVYVAAKPGKPVSFEIDHPEKGSKMTVTVRTLD